MGAPAWLTARPVAHRGYHDRDAGRIENTIPAAEAAIARGFAIECDLQLTRDDVAIVFHDDTLDRLTEATGPVEARTLAELKAIPLRGTEARIPTLDEFLAAVAGRVPIFAEFKSGFDRNRRLEQVAAPRLNAYQGPLAVMSFDPDSVLALKKLAPALPRGMVADSFTDAEWAPIPPLRRLALRHLAAAAAGEAELHRLRRPRPAGRRAAPPPPPRHAAPHLDGADRGRPRDGARATPTRSSSRASTPRATGTASARSD